MKELTIFLLLCFISCGNLQENGPVFSENESEEVILQGNYKVLKLRSRNISAEEVILDFKENENRVAGHTGCNRFGARYEQSKDSIGFEQVNSTKMYCEGKMGLEKEIIELLPYISEVKKAQDQVVFFSENKEQLLIITKTGNSE